jgi:hypothetical protein
MGHLRSFGPAPMSPLVLKERTTPAKFPVTKISHIMPTFRADDS